MPNTPRLSLGYPAGTDNVSAYPAQAQSAMTTLDNEAVIFLQGTAAARPAAGTQGRFYYETDTGLLKWDTGSAWTVPPPAASSVTASMLADAAKLGLSDGSNTRRGSSVIATTETRTNTAYGLMPTPDKVAGIVLPTNGLIAISYQATWQESVSHAAAAAIFVGANQLKVAQPNMASPLTQAAFTDSPSAAAVDLPLFTTPLGLASAGQGATPPAYTGDVTTGQALGIATDLNAISFQNMGVYMLNESFLARAVNQGGPCYIFAAAGTYDISVQFRATSGNVTVKNRKLWVWTIGF